MQQYPVPQFIEEEARIAFFLTVKQFVYIVVAGAVIFLLYHLLPFFLFVIAGGAVAIIALSLGFIKINGFPLITLILNSLGFVTKNKNYTWKKKESLYPFKVVKTAQIKKIEEEPILRGEKKSGLKKLRTKVELRIE